VKSSGLLQTIAEGIQELTEGLDLFQVMVVFCFMVLICTTFISHTVRMRKQGHALDQT
jgi:phosphate transporter